MIWLDARATQRPSEGPPAKVVWAPGSVGDLLHIPGVSHGRILCREPFFNPAGPIVFSDLDPVLLPTRRNAERRHASVQEQPDVVDLSAPTKTI
jgi:hypothetical protein